ncbi:interleukin-1 beta-like [Lissotriton helveticus]
MEAALTEGGYGAEAFTFSFEPAKFPFCRFGAETQEIPRSDEDEGGVTLNEVEELGNVDQGFRHFSNRLCRITDSTNKSLVLYNALGQTQLVALYPQGSDAARQATLNMNFYSWLPGRNSRKQPVTLSIVGSNLFLSCALVDEEPKLRLEEVSGKLTSLQGALVRFIFFMASGPVFTFESATCPMWFLSTSQNENMPMTVSSSGDQTSIQNFKVIPL